jgi:cathepsin L
MGRTTVAVLVVVLAVVLLCVVLADAKKKANKNANQKNKNKGNNNKPKKPVNKAMAKAKKLFAKFVKDHRITFKNKNQRTRRFQNFVNNLKFIDNENGKRKKAGKAFKLRVGPFADLSFAEFLLTRTGGKASTKSKKNKRTTDELLSKLALAQAVAPPTMDWRASGKVGRVRDQKSCGSCWAFATAGVLESHWAIKHGRLPSLSPQHLIDCARSPCRGCNGGDQMCAYTSVLRLRGLRTEKSYKYRNKKGKCSRSKKSIGAKVTTSPLGAGYIRLPSTELDIRTFVGTMGPVTVGVCASPHWQHYGGDVIEANECNCALNHFVQIVGYTNNGGRDVWIVKNSWGAKWGQGGYAFVERSSCNVLQQPVAPIVV